MHPSTSSLRDAQERAEQLIAAIESRALIEPGVSETELSNRVHALAHEMFGTPTWWHRRVIRAGRNTLCPYAEHPPDLQVQSDDIVFVDLGPVFDGWEADLGKTYVLGDDPMKAKVRDDIEEAFARGRAYFEAQPEITCAQLFHYVEGLAAEYGWKLGAWHTGHLVGEFPHSKFREDKAVSFIHPDNHLPMRGVLSDGRPKHWILELHFVDPERGFGGFYEALLNA